ncbi:MAG: HD domain-containing phosphohydrolase [Spirochaetota bacterium]|nr:HD domain-containing phosphohydrolase [Spirochaetota bacterium]
MNIDLLKQGFENYNNSGKTSTDILSLLSTLMGAVDFTNGEDVVIDILNEISMELIGLTTEMASFKQKNIEASTKKVIMEYMLAFLSKIENDILNDSQIELHLYEKIKKMINDYLQTNYFSKIIVVTRTDNLIDTIYSDDISFVNHFRKVLTQCNMESQILNSFIETYSDILDDSNFSEIKVAFRKCLLEHKENDDRYCKFWKILHDISSMETCLKLQDSFNDYLTNAESYRKNFISPLLSLYEPQTNKEDKFQRISFNEKEYFVSSIFIQENNSTKTEKIISQIRALGYEEEAVLLEKQYFSNRPISEISDSLGNLPLKLKNELLQLKKSQKTCIGHLIISDPITEIYEKNGSLNFIIKMFLDSVNNMCEILLLNEHTFQDFQQNLLVTLQQISYLRDSNTASHQDRVSLYTQILATILLDKKENHTLDELIKKNDLPSASDYFLISKEYIRDLLYSASLHDLGKIGIDDSILKNPSKLTDEEFVIMKKHTIYGEEKFSAILKACGQNSFLKQAAKLAGNHHEKWNGTGYPTGKKGFEIPLSARILTIADVYDALRIARSYKPAFTHKEAFDIIVSQKGTAFDPLLIDIFVENHLLFAEIFPHKEDK